MYLASAELSAIASKLGRLPTVEEYRAEMGVVEAKSADIYRYLNFDKLPEYTAAV